MKDPQEVCELHVESLIGHHLRDADGRSLGRIEEIVAEVQGTDWVVVEVHTGPGALFERLIELSTLVPFFGAVQKHVGKRHRIRWDKLDLTDPSRPKATVRQGELVRPLP